jgi:hypothetical protein
MSEYPGGWFGESWGAPVCVPERHLPVPTGQPCVECTQPVQETDQGLLIPYANDGGWELTAYHLPCFLATVLPRRGER